MQQQGVAAHQRIPSSRLDILTYPLWRAFHTWTTRQPNSHPRTGIKPRHASLLKSSLYTNRSRGTEGPCTPSITSNRWSLFYRLSSNPQPWPTRCRRRSALYNPLHLHGRIHHTRPNHPAASLFLLQKEPACHQTRPPLKMSYILLRILPIIPIHP